MTQALPNTSYGNTHREPCHGRHNSGEPAQPRSILKNPLAPQSSDPNAPSHYTEASTQTSQPSTNAGELHHPCEPLGHYHRANSTRNPYPHPDSTSTYNPYSHPNSTYQCPCYTPGAQATHQQHRGPWRDPYCASHNNHSHHQCHITPTHPFHFNPASNFTPAPTPTVHHHSHSGNRATNPTSTDAAVATSSHTGLGIKPTTNYPKHFCNGDRDRQPNGLKEGESALTKLGLTPPTSCTTPTTSTTSTTSTTRDPPTDSYPEHNPNPAKDTGSEGREQEERGRSRTRRYMAESDQDHRAYPYLVRSPDYGGRGWVMLPSPPSSLERRGSWVREREPAIRREDRREARRNGCEREVDMGDVSRRYRGGGGGRGDGSRRTVYEDRYAEHDDEEVEGREAIEVLGGLVALVVSKVARVLGDENEEEEMEGVRRGRGERRGKGVVMGERL